MTNQDPNQQVAQQNPNENEQPDQEEQEQQVSEQQKGQPASQPNVNIPREGFGDKDPDDTYDAEDDTNE